MLNHGINAYKSDTNFTSVTGSDVGVPFFVGCWPCHTAGGYTGMPQLAYNYTEAVKLGGYSDEWRNSDGSPKWSLCQALYAFFKIFAASPAIFFNVFNPEIHKKSVDETTKDVSEHLIKLPYDAFDNDNLVVKDSDTTLVKGTDYDVYYDGGNLIIELIKTSSHYSATTLTVAYEEADLSTITAETIESAIEMVEVCKAVNGIVPENICVPGYSSNPTVAAVMSAKAANINDMFKGNAICDLDTSASGADSYEKVSKFKKDNGYVNENMIVCWPLAKIGDKVFDFSVIYCGLMSAVDAENDSVPYESPSNRDIPITGCVNAVGEDVILTTQQANAVNDAGVITAINYGGWKSWGNYTACYPANKDVAKYFVCTKRMSDFVCNTFVSNYWSYVDRPLTRVQIDAILNSFNVFLNGLQGAGMIYGGEMQYVEDNNSTADLLKGKFRLDAKFASPVPAQQIDMFVEFDIEMLTSSINV
ncbi:MAG: phage tail sheath family protein [Acutalibacteraceae bacterium]